MGHYLSEFEDPSPLDTIKSLYDSNTLEKGKFIMKHKGYWQKGGECYLVTYHEMKHDDRKWYEIHCRRHGEYFITISAKEWDSYDK